MARKNKTGNRSTKIKNYFLQMLNQFIPVILGVYLGIVASNWNQERVRLAEQKEFVNNLYLELQTNKSKMEESLVYREAVVLSARKASQELDPQILKARFWSVGHWKHLPAWEGVKIPILENSVYQSGIMTNALSGLDFKIINSIARAYNYQDDYKLWTRRKILDLLDQMPSDINTSDVLLKFESWYDLIATEQELINQYEQTLDIISKYNHAEPKNLNIIEGDVYLSVNKKHITADLNFQYVSSKSGISEINLYLSKEVNIDKLEGESIKNFKFDKEAMPLATLTVYFKQPLVKGTVSNFTLSYSGTPSKGFWTDAFGWIDVDPDFMILPVFTDFNSFDYNLHAELDDPNYNFIDVEKGKMSSTLDVKGESVSYFESIVAGKGINFDIISKNGYTINIISSKPDSTIDFIGNKAVEILDFYNNAFGERNKVKNFSILYRPLPDSVFRTIRNLTDKKFIMFSDNHERISTLAHEISHFWWHRGNDFTMEKWLDESFAQYSELMYVRETEGRDRFQEEISRLANKVKDLPSLLQSDRFSKHGSALLYEKGPYLLYQLEETLGEKKFNELLIQLNAKGISTTDGMLHELEKISSVEIKNNFEEMLMH